MCCNFTAPRQQRFGSTPCDSSTYLLPAEVPIIFSVSCAAEAISSKLLALAFGCPEQLKKGDLKYEDQISEIPRA